MNDIPAIHPPRRLTTSTAPYRHAIICQTGGCPAVYESEYGTYLVVGRRLNAIEKAGLSMDSIEDALEVPKDLLDQLAKMVRR